jgi:hypothetical protein
VRFCLLLFAVGCGRLNFDETDALVVSTTQDRLAGPPTMTSVDEVQADDLSLREALAIAANREGDDLILFSDAVFPVDARATITLGSALEVAGNNTHVDGRGRGVVIEAPANLDVSQLHITGNSIALFGLTIRGGMQARIHVDNVATPRIDTVRFDPPGGTAVRVVGSQDVALVDLVIEQPAGNGIEIANCTNLNVKGVTIEQPRDLAIAAMLSTELDIHSSTITLDKTATNPGVLFVDVDRSKIRDNVIDPGPVRLISLESSSGNEITGNILDGGNVGIGLFGDSLANLVFRNVIMFADNEAMFIDAIALGNRVLHNTLFMNSSGISNDAPDTEITNTLETSNADEFVDPLLYDFKLVAESTSIDAATDTGLDLLPGDPSQRFLGAAPDLGAVESL